MPESIKLAPYHDPDCGDWVYEQLDQELYPRYLAKAHYLGWTIGSCRWDGRGFFYATEVPTDPRTLSLTVRFIGGKVDAGNRHPRARTALYRFFGEPGDLLYVGISGDPVLRGSQHASDKNWWSEVFETKVEWFNNRDVALAHEEAAIKREKPLYNIHHNGKRRAKAAR
ncbi:hypothetical protein [Streptomyces sp. 4R-3d]|uniref:hypothetical protein n=1 Tax=Streptomyces sp. 4R-3d TaxID=2559605 RepID=UPI0010717009|nr:hypothetical protein [Streptomyces sp. 4R-3d]TFI30125.1 hypothetical protein E4P36_05085 [Streptomyces sp. 4R-3d]